MRWPAVAVAVAASLLASATLKLHIFAAPPVSLLFPLGDVPGGPFDRVKVLYLNASGMYITLAAMGNVILATNTTGWRIFASKIDNIAPTGATASPPPPGHCINATWKVSFRTGAVLTHKFKLCNYNGTHGIVIDWTASSYGGYDEAAWAAKIMRTGGLYVWYPVVPDSALRDYVVAVARTTSSKFVMLFVPDIGRFSYFNSSEPSYRRIDFCADAYDFTVEQWHYYPQWCYGRPISPLYFHDLAGTEAVDAMSAVVADSGAVIYLYWPVVAYYVPGPTSTYLRAQVG